MSLKPQERLKIIAEYIRTGNMREGYKITESKEGKYRVSVVRDEKDALIKKRAKLVKKLAALDKLIEEQQSNSDTALLRAVSEPSDEALCPAAETSDEAVL